MAITISSRKAVTLAAVRSVSFVFRFGAGGVSVGGSTASVTTWAISFSICVPICSMSFHVRIPFSSLYPWPQTTFKYRGSAGSISIFSRRWRMWTATVFSLPKGASLHTLR